MPNAGRILLADDEATFLNATADLFRAEGYECVTAQNGDRALAEAGASEFDLLITDLEMPGNSELQLVRRIAEGCGGLPVIILTGFPSVRSAVACIDLPVVAYLTKPVAFPELLHRAERAVKRFRLYQAMQRAEQRMRSWRDDLQQLASGEATVDGKVPADLFLTLTLRNVMGSLTDIEHLGRALAKQPVDQHACQLLNCPRGTQLKAALTETVKVLEDSKSAFKSKALAELRKKLELALDTV